MITYLQQAMLSNAVFSLILAIVAVMVGFTARRPQLSYLLWLLVLIKLLTPPVMSIPVTGLESHLIPGIKAASDADLDVVPGDGIGPELPAGAHMPQAMQDLAVLGQTNPDPQLASRLASYLSILLAVGSLVLLIWSLVHILWFARRLKTDARLAPDRVQDIAKELAGKLGLTRTPLVYATTARVSPLVWWINGGIAVVMPDKLIGQMDVEHLELVLGHELAHVRRRDYIVRLVEWVAGIIFWWNPVVWWAQRNLRAAEEICCDALVLSCLKPRPRSYAKSLLAVVEFLAYPGLRPPALASEINSGGFFLRRCRMIVTDKPNRSISLWIKLLVLLLALTVLPLGAHLYAKDKAEAQSEKQIKQEKQANATQDQSVDEYLKQLEQELKTKVMEGKLTEGEANAKFDSVSMSIKAMMYEEQSVHAKFKAAKAGINAALAEGQLSTEEAEAKFKELEEMMDDVLLLNKKTNSVLSESWHRQCQLIAEGMLTFEDAVREYDGVKADAFEKAGTPLTALTKFDEAVADLSAKIKAGKMSHAEAMDRFRALEMSVYMKQCIKAEEKYRFDAIEASLQAMVAKGEITKEEAEAKLKAVLQDENELKLKQQAEQKEKELKKKEEMKKKEAEKKEKEKENK